MAGYNEIRGLRVKYLSADPSNPENGQVWYNSTTGNLRVQGIGVGAWSSGANMSQTRANTSGAGTQTAGLAIGGYTGVSTNTTGITEEYNGSGWGSGGTLNVAAFAKGSSGTQTAALDFGGGPPDKATTESYDGSSWTEVNDLGTARRDTCGTGTQTASLCIAGTGGPTLTEEFDGTNWTAGGALNTGRPKAAGSGIGLQTAALLAGGSPYQVNVEAYNGSTWSEGPNLNTGREGIGSSGNQTSALIFGGYVPGSASNKTENWDGTSWTNGVNYPTATYELGSGNGTSGSSSALGFGGNGNTSATNEYNFSTSTVTAAAWSSNPALSYSVDANLASSGSLTSAVAAGGYNAPAGPGTVSYIAKAATWNGTAWSNITDMPVRRTSNNAVGATAPAFYTFGGQNQPGPSTSTHLPSTFNWNGSSWGAGPNLAEGQSGGAAAGTPSAIVLMGGTNPPGSISNNIQQYNGSSWSNSPVNMPTNMSGQGGVGTQTAAISFGGYQGASPFPSAGVTNTYEWDGSSISSGGSMVFGLLGCSGSGTSTAALSYGGRNTAGNKNAIGMLYNGTSWATSPSLGTARDYIAMGPMGSATSCLAVAGSGGAQSLVEEFTGETTTVNPARNITTS